MNAKFYDIESLDNVFTCTVWEPSKNKIRVYFIDDDNMLGLDEKTKRANPARIQGPVADRMTAAILERNPRLMKNGKKPPDVLYFNLQHADGLIRFMRDMYVTSKDEAIRANMNLIGERLVFCAETMSPATVRNNENIKRKAKPFIELCKIYKQNRGNQWLTGYLFAGTPSDTDPNFDENNCPYLLGYNSYNYDSTMIAYVVSEMFVSDVCKGMNSSCVRVHENGESRRVYLRKTVEPKDKPKLTAKQVRRFNDLLFSSEMKSNMSTGLRLVNSDSRQQSSDWKEQRQQTWYDNCETYLCSDHDMDVPTFGIPENVWLPETQASMIRNGMLRTGLHVDVGKLNEKLAKVALKRLLGMLGHQIFESDKLHGDVTHISTPDEMDELVAYNVSDVVCLESLFHDRVYASSFDLKSNMLKTYPELVYDTDQRKLKSEMAKARASEQGQDLDPNTARKISTAILGKKTDENDSTPIVRQDRLYADSSSQQLASKALSPLGKLADKQSVSLVYPDEKNAQDSPKGHPFDVLEDAKEFFFNNVLPCVHDDRREEAKENFMHVYRAYARIRGLNFDDSAVYKSTHKSQPLHYLKDVAADLPWCLPYYDGNGNETSYFAVFSTGGVHGAEYNKRLFDADKDAAQKKLDILNRAKAYFGETEEGAIRLRNNVKRLKDPLHLCPLGEKPEADEWGDGQEHFVSEFLKSGATKSKAAWRDIDLPTLWTDTMRSVIQVTDEGHRAIRVETNGRTPEVLFEKDGAVFAKTNDDKYIECGVLQNPSDNTPGGNVKNMVTTICFKNGAKRRMLGYVMVSSCKRELKKRYTFTSAGYTNHEDFSSYYPSLLRQMNVFFNPLLGYDRYGEIYLDKERFGKMMKDPNRSEEERMRLSLDRNGVKLILNTASGAGDAKFDNPIRMNNNIIAMRMIGQLFTWQIGQTQALQGAGVPSTNTDGLYTIMEETKNNQLLEEAAKNIGVLIEPEPMHLISKDSNNRLEFMILAATDESEYVQTGFDKKTGKPKYGYAWFSCPYTDEDGTFHEPKWVETAYGETHAVPEDADIDAKACGATLKDFCYRAKAKFKVLSASGGSLACRRGPDMTKALAHPAVTDWALSEYLMRTYLKHDCEQKALDSDFDEVLGRIIMEEARMEQDMVHMLRMFQNVLASNPSSYTFVFYQDVTPEDIESGNDDPADKKIGLMQHYNRVFIMSPKAELETHRLWLARARVVPAPTLRSRQRKGAELTNTEAAAYYVLKSNLSSTEMAEIKQSRDIVRQKVSQIDPTWDILIENGDLMCMPEKQQLTIRNGLNIDAYVALLSAAYAENWRNVVPNTTR